MSGITLLSGSGRYSDPWHPFAATSALLASALGDLGSVDIREDVDDTLRELADASSRPELLVVNIGNSLDDAPPAPARDALLKAAEAGMPLLAIHSAATAFPAWSDWPRLIGGRWVRGVSFHPPLSDCTITVTPAGQELIGVAAFDTSDERYTALELEPESVPLATHLEQGATYPLAWSYRRQGVRAIYLGLGHEKGAYAAAETTLLVRSSAAALLGQLP